MKRAGVFMDGGKLDEGLALFDTALGLDPTAADALLHQANLCMIQQKLADINVISNSLQEYKCDYNAKNFCLN